MPVIELGMLQETFDKLMTGPMDGVRSILALKEQLAYITDRPSKEIGIKTTIWPYAVDMEDIEVVVHLGSHWENVEQLIERVNARFEEVFIDYSHVFPVGFKIGIWPQSPANSHYHQVMLNPV